MPIKNIKKITMTLTLSLLGSQIYAPQSQAATPLSPTAFKMVSWPVIISWHP